MSLASPDLPSVVAIAFEFILIEDNLVLSFMNVNKYLYQLLLALGTTTTSSQLNLENAVANHVFGECESPSTTS
ncbi:hypothetical protein QUA62_27545 [Microcoleus sp. MON1_C1]|uniref:hypothetical protein n=1 Tax=Microcoleus sp. MON1_C1 TaxID=2818827 RepID=UPI002FD320F2